MTDVSGRLRGAVYRAVMRFAHRYHWHYAPPIYPEGDTQLWCKWCGFRQTIRRAGDRDITGELVSAHARERPEPFLGWRQLLRAWRKFREPSA